MSKSSEILSMAEKKTSGRHSKRFDDNPKATELNQKLAELINRAKSLQKKLPSMNPREVDRVADEWSNMVGYT